MNIKHHNIKRYKETMYLLGVDLEGECTMCTHLSERVIVSARMTVAEKLALIEWEVVRGKPRSAQLRLERLERIYGGRLMRS